MSNAAQPWAQGKRLYKFLLSVTAEEPGSEPEAETWPYLVPGSLNSTLFAALESSQCGRGQSTNKFRSVKPAHLIQGSIPHHDEAVISRQPPSRRRLPGARALFLPPHAARATRLEVALWPCIWGKRQGRAPGAHGDEGLTQTTQSREAQSTGL